MKHLLAISALASGVAVSAACGGERQRNVLGPTAADTLAVMPPATGSGSEVQTPSVIGASVSARQEGELSSMATLDPDPAPGLDPEPAPDPEPEPEPEPTPTPAPAPSPHHVEPGPIDHDRAKQVVFATSHEFPHLVAAMGSEHEAVAAADELLGRTIWHLQLAGFQAARQRNPSAAISSDKVSIVINGRWRVYDVFSLGVAGRATRVHWIEVPLPNPVANDGIPD